jgi:hypothetical protein
MITNNWKLALAKGHRLMLDGNGNTVDVPYCIGNEYEARTLINNHCHTSDHEANGAIATSILLAFVRYDNPRLAQEFAEVYIQ